MSECSIAELIAISTYLVIFIITVLMAVKSKL